MFLVPLLFALFCSRRSVVPFPIMAYLHLAALRGCNFSTFEHETKPGMKRSDIRNVAIIAHVDFFKKAIKAHDFETAATYCGPEYAEQLRKAAPAAKPLAEEIDNLNYKMAKQLN